MNITKYTPTSALPISTACMWPSPVLSSELILTWRNATDHERVLCIRVLAVATTKAALPTQAQGKVFSAPFDDF